MNRRIVTDGYTIRIQCNDGYSPLWTFYPGSYQTAKEAQRVIDLWKIKDRMEAECRWTVMETPK